MKLCKSCAKQVFDFADKKEKECQINKRGITDIIWRSQEDCKIEAWRELKQNTKKEMKDD